MEEKNIVKTVEDAIEVIKNDDMYNNFIDTFSSQSEGIIKSVDYSKKEIKIHVNKNKWFENAKMLRYVIDDIIVNNNMTSFVEVQISIKNSTITVKGWN
jgi:hypothetical protein